MVQVNEQFLDLPGSYLFSEIARRVQAYKTQNPSADLIRMGIGDVTRPLVKAIVEAMHQAVDEMGDAATFKGYGPEQGYAFLREQIIKTDYESRGVHISPDEIFISDGCKSDMGNFGDILGRDNIVAVSDPVYPVYVDTNVMDGRAGSLQGGAWDRIVYMPCKAEHLFTPELPAKPADVIYLCFPNNPTGTTITKKELKNWVDYALKTGALILYDSAYEAFIVEEEVPHSIYEIEGAEKCAVEFRSFSKTAGFTGLRCGYTIVPKAVEASTKDGRRVSLNPLWNRRQTTKFNGVSYVTQKAAEAVYSEEGLRQTRENIAFYLENAAIIRTSLTKLGIKVFGGINAPYIWFKTPDGSSSWDFFNRMLSEINVIGTPGSGFGPSGEGYLRLTAFGSREATLAAVERISNWNI